MMDNISGISQVSVMHPELYILFMWILVKMIHTFSVEKGASSFYAMNVISFFEEKLGEICTVLACNTCNQSNFHVSEFMFRGRMD